MVLSEYSPLRGPEWTQSRKTSAQLASAPAILPLHTACERGREGHKALLCPPSPSHTSQRVDFKTFSVVPLLDRFGLRRISYIMIACPPALVLELVVTLRDLQVGHYIRLLRGQELALPDAVQVCGLGIGWHFGVRASGCGKRPRKLACRQTESNSTPPPQYLCGPHNRLLVQYIPERGLII